MNLNKHVLVIIVFITLPYCSFKLIASSNLDESCTTDLSTISFAHCKKAEKNFRTAILAIHGWNGTCRTTFGEQKNSLYKVLGTRQFYDFDCFQYDSTHLSIRENTDALHFRLRELDQLGYQRIFLVTHSTGGIIAQQLIVDKYVDKLSIANNYSLNILEIHAWATPINGLRSNISVPGKLLSALGFSPETLPDLDADSDYLENLKLKMKSFNNQYAAATAFRQGKMEIKTVFYQGQGEDWVVHSIEKATGVNDGWFNSSLHTIVNTNQGHSHNIGKSGTNYYPTYPAEMLTNSALLNLKVIPRYEDVFPSNISVVTIAMENRQRKVVDGLIFYATKNFTGAFGASIDFLHRIYTQSFDRSHVVDEELVKGFLDTLERRAAKPDEDFISFVDKFIAQVITPYEPGGGEELRKLGYNNSNVVNMILETVVLMRKVKNIYMLENGFNINNSDAALYSSLDTFNNKMLNITQRFLASSHGPVQRKALEQIYENIQDIRDTRIISNNLVTGLSSYYLENEKYNKLNQHAKDLVANTFAHLLKNSYPSQAIMTSLNTSVTYLGETRPSWFTLNNKNVVHEVIKAMPTDGRLITKNQEQLLFSIAEHGGVMANDYSSSIMAIEKAQKLIGQKAISINLMSTIENAKENSPFPKISYEIDRKFLKINETNFPIQQ
ncbi:MAG: alpha/beta hydrolase [Colwellia sp.]|nr:alpha/beta hydrolase [Colwellia sp.]